MANYIIKIATWLAIWASLSLLAGCATRGEIKRFQQQAEYLTQANAEQQRQLARLDSLLTEQQELLRKLSATQQYNMEQLQAEMKIIEAIFKESGYQVSELTQKIDEIRQEMVTVQPPQDSSDTSASVEPQVTVNPKQLFETAQLDYNKGKYELAKMEFEQFLSLFSKSALADDAQYYIGECSFALGKYADARAEYQKVKQIYPQSNLVPDALFRAGIAAMRMDDAKGAAKLFREIVDNYKQSDVAPRAEEKLKNIGQE